MVRELSDYFDVVMLAKAGEATAPEIATLRVLVGLNHRITIQPSSSTQVAQDRAGADAVRHREARGVRHPRLLQGDGHHITPRHWTESSSSTSTTSSSSAHCRQGRHRRRGDPHRAVGHARELRRARRRAPLARPARRRGVARGLPARVRGGVPGAVGQAGDPPVAHPPLQGGVHAVASEIKTKMRSSRRRSRPTRCSAAHQVPGRDARPPMFARRCRHCCAPTPCMRSPRPTPISPWTSSSAACAGVRENWPYGVIL